MFIDAFNIIGYVKKQGYLVGDVLIVPSVPKLLDEMRQVSGDEIRMNAFKSLLQQHNIKITKKRCDYNG
jgi:hypothetical protein